MLVIAEGHLCYTLADLMLQDIYLIPRRTSGYRDVYLKLSDLRLQGHLFKTLSDLRLQRHLFNTVPAFRLRDI